MKDLDKFIKRNSLNNGKGIYEIENTLFHLTPNDLGKSILLEPRQSAIDDFKAISTAIFILNCLYALPKNKQTNDEFFIYRTQQPTKAFREIWANNKADGEAKLFQKTKFIRVAKVKNCLYAFNKFNKIDGILDFENTKLIDDIVNNLIIDKEKKNYILPLSFANNRYKLI